jgi:hypothetical protein
MNVVIVTLCGFLITTYSRFKFARYTMSVGKIRMPGWDCSRCGYLWLSIYYLFAL